MISILVPNDSDAEKLVRLLPEDHIQVWHPDTHGAIPDAEVILLRRPKTYENLHELGNIESLRLIQLASLGYEWLDLRVHRNAVIANSAGTCESSVAEVAVLHVLGSLKGLQGFAADRRRQVWNSREVDTIVGSRIAVLGAGGLGLTIARYLQVFEPRWVRIYGRTARRSQDGLKIHALDQLADTLSEVDVLVLALPLTPDTAHLVDRRFLSQMRKGAHLVNVGRGTVVDTGALRTFLAEGRIHAAVDVIDPEPLPPGDTLWNEDNFLLTPHVGGNSLIHETLAFQLIANQVERLRSGRPLLNVVNR